MRSIKRGLGTAIGFAMTAGFTVVIVGLVLSLAAIQVPVLKTLGTEFRCVAGIPLTGDACVQDRIAALEDQRRNLRLQSDALLTQKRDLEDERDRLSRIIAQQSYVFEEGGRVSGGATLVVGTLYRDADRRTGIMRSFCWAIIDRGGFDPRVGLAVMESDGRITANAVDDDDLDMVGIDRQNLAQIRASCPFPGVS